MDPLSTIASVAGIISLILPVAKSVKEFYINCKHQNEQVAQVLTRLSQLERMLNMTEDHIGKRKFDPEQESVKAEIEEVLHDYEGCVKDLQQEYSKFDNRTRRWEYPFRKSTLERLKEDIDDIVEHLFRILELLKHKDMDTVRRHTEDTHGILKLVRADQISSSIRDWLKAPDATVDYNKTDEKRHPNTGLWFLEGPAFSSWLSKGNSFLGLYGFAGCGKSVLSSTIIKHLFDHQILISSTSEFRTGIGFFFFTFRDDSKQDSSAMLRALILQLSAQLEDGHKLLSQVHDSHYRHGTPPDTILVECLERLVRSFDRIYLVLDALDEVPNDRDREKVLKVISTMREWSIPGLHLLVTSREEEHIRTSLFPATEASSEAAISLKNAQVNSDILSYVSHFLKTDRRLEWINMHHHDWVDWIVKQISDRAGGVFRLAECHLISLQQCLKAKKYLKKALETLPESLDETYERMLDQVIQKGYKNQAKRLFTILCLSRKPLGVQEVLDCMAVELRDEPFFDPDARLRDETELCRIAPGLVELQDNGRRGVRIAHFSVQEYLLCDRISASKVRTFGISPEVAHGDMASIYITFLQQPPDPKRPNTYSYASQYWTTHAFLANPKPPALSAILSKPEEIPFNYLEALLTSHHSPDSVTEESICWLVEQGVPINIRDEEWRTPLHYAVMNGWGGCVRILLARGAQMVTDNRYMTPFHCSVWVESREIAQIFLDAKVPVDLGIEKRPRESMDSLASNVENRPSKLALLQTSALQPDTRCCLTPLHFAAVYGSEIMTHFLLNEGANPNISSEHGETPLHVALKGKLHRPPRMILMGSDDDGSNAIWAAISSLSAYPEEALNEWYRGSLEGRADSLGDCFDGPDDQEYHEAADKLRQDQARVAGLILSHQLTNIHAQDNQGKTPLHVALEVEDEISVAALLGKGARVSDTDNEGLNALHYAARTGKINLIRRVVESIHDTFELMRLGESTDNQERSVLHHILAELDAFDGLIYLLKHTPVDINHLDKEGISPLAKLLSRGCRLSEHYLDMAAALLTHGADPTLKVTIKENGKTFDGLGLGHLFVHEFGLSLQGLEPKTLKVLADYKVNLGALDGQGRSIIHHGALSGSLTKESLDYLCNEVGLSLDSLDADGETPVDYAEEESRKSRPWYIFAPERWSRTRDLLVDYRDAKRQIQGVLVAGE